METVISAPGVSLRNVEVRQLAFTGQTFLLGFDVTNPNPFPLPIRTVAYGIELAGHHFAGGTAESAFTVVAGGDTAFSISVDLDLLHTSPQLLYIIHDGVTHDIPYELEGRFGVDLPFAKPVIFKASGEIRLQASQL
jgi:LEA14-like dessication related protein